MGANTMHETGTAPENKTIPFFPDHVRSEAKVVGAILGVVILLGILGLLLPMGLGDPADPMNTPAHVKPEWYFLALYQLLKYIPKTIGAVIPVLLVILVALWPFLDRKPEVSKQVQRKRLIVVLVGMIVLVALTIWGEVS
jgi:quinol-cytochrome oxidoreductase complex cytochrome b subunit